MNLFKIIIKIILSSILILCCKSPNNFDSIVKNEIFNIPTIELPNQIEDIFEVCVWGAIGPFTFDTTKQNELNTFDNKDLKQFGINEEIFSENDLKKVIGPKWDPFKITGNSASVKLFNYINNESFNDISNFYLFNIIISPVEQEVTLIFDGSSSYKVWLNQEEILKVTRKHSIYKVGDQLVNVNLKKGKNLILIKINRGANRKSFDLVLGISSITKAKEIFRTNYLKDFIQNPIITDSLQVYIGPYSDGTIQIFDQNQNKIIDTVFSNKPNREQIVIKNLDQLKSGFYNCKLILDESILEEQFFKGNFPVFIERLESTIDSLSFKGEVLNDISAGLERVIFLCNEYIADSSPSEIRYLNKNRIFWTKQLIELVKATKLKNIDGTFLRTYMNDNGSIYYFLLHIGKNTSKKSNIPLVIAVPYALSGKSMITDWYISNLDQIEVDNMLADKYGFALAWVYMNGKDYSPTKGMDDVIRVVKRIRDEYKTDTSKVFVIGDCEGGRKALLLVERQPDLFSGIAVSQPVTLSGKDIAIDYVKNLYNVPIIIKHGKNDLISPIENSYQFISEASRYGYNPKLIETNDNHLFFSKDYRKYAFEFFDSLKRIKNKKVPTHIKYETYDLDNISSYWIELVNINRAKMKAEIEANYSNKNQQFNIICSSNIQEYNILLNKLSIQKGTLIKIYTNNKLSYYGKVSGAKINIKL